MDRATFLRQDSHLRDREAYPGRCVDDFWTANPLHFGLEYASVADGNVQWICIIIGLGVVVAIVVAAVILKVIKGKRKGGIEETSTPIGEWWCVALDCRLGPRLAIC